MDKLNLLWITTNKETVFNMLSMYAINAKKNDWWKEVNVIIWGGSARLVAEDAQVQAEVIEMMHQGVKVEACKACADNLGVSAHLEKLGVTVKYMGEPLTEYLKSGEKVLSI